MHAFIDFVTAINAINGRVWINLAFFAVLLFLYGRYRKVPPSGSIVDTLNSTHIAVFGFAICVMGSVLVLLGHEQFGDKVFLSGASFIGGMAAQKAVSPKELPTSPNV